MKSRVHDVRNKLEMPQNRLAELCGVSRQTIHAIEVGKYQPTITLALKLAKHLNIEVEKLFILERED
ncbi:MAG: helix-turn-helix transcriptional regulator [Bdellovibrionales bacterium]